MKNIMIVDDDIDIGNMLEELLVQEGYRVTRAYSGTEALFVLASYKPDLILLDLIVGKKGNAILLSEDDWNAIQETLYLNSIEGMVESIVSGGNTPLEECVSEDVVEW